jgi:hypothetical protein
MQAAMRVDSARIIPSNNSIAPSAFAILSFKNNGVTVTEASIPALPADSAFLMYAESAATPGGMASIHTAVSIANSAQSTITVNFELRSMDGTPTGLSTSATLAPGGQLSKFISELFPGMPATFRGSLALTATSPVSVTGFRTRYNERGDFLISANPPSNESTVPGGPDVLFPYVVSGEGYTTEIILFGSR